jgi:hypothetical protein
LVRIYTLKETLKEQIEYPLGQGFSNIYIRELYAFKNPHSNLTQLFRAGGIIGFVALIIMAIEVVKNSVEKVKSNLNRITIVETTLLVCFINFNLYGLTHVTTGFLFFWIIFSLLLNPGINK